MQIQRIRQSGFTLIEMAIVMAVMAFLVGGLVAPLSAQRENQQREETRQMLTAGTEALYGFAITNGRLPCPDTNNDGLEDNPCAVANNQVNNGRLPFATLGVRGIDPWNNRLFYSVNGAFTAAFVLNQNTANPGTLRVIDGDLAAANCNIGTAADDVPAVLWSSAKNDFTAITPVSADELENSDADNCYITRRYNTVAGNEFDDQLAWLSRNVLFNRMITAGTLP